MIKNEDDKINDIKKNDECNGNQNDLKKWKKKTILTWPSLWLQVFHNPSHFPNIPFITI